MIIEIKKISDLKPAPYNPRQSTEKQEKKLQESLNKFGVVEPIIFNKQTGYIVGGHFRVRELKKLGYKEVECVIVDLSEEDEKELNIRLNANTGDWDWDILKNEWNEELLNDWGLDLPAYDIGHEANNITEEDINIDADFDPIGISAGQQRVVFIFETSEDAETYLSKNKIEFVKRNMAWQVNMNTQSI